MNPQATLNELLEAVGKRDWDRIDELATSLIHWMDDHKFPPITLGPPALGPTWHRTLATFVCYMAQAMVREARKRRERRPSR